jgi:protein tyrosine phosphatase (PTP) superfamily phosphohydrolase (DUF442 family)
VPTRRGVSLACVVFASLAWPTAATSDAAADAPRITRFQQVDARLYRGGQPDKAAFEHLKQLGIRTVVNLRRNDAERAVVESLGMRYVYLATSLHPFGVGGGPRPEQVVARFFEVVDDPSSGPVFLHCRRGADRTGTLVAMYRIARQRWTAASAYEEARATGMRWWHYPVKGYLERFASRVRTEPNLAITEASTVP